MREAELLDSVHKAYPKARLTAEQAGSLVREHGHWPCLMAVAEMQEKNFDWSLETYKHVVAEVKAQQQGDAAQRQQRRAEAEKRVYEAERNDPAAMERMRALCANAKAFAGGRMSRREFLERQRELVASGPAAGWRNEQVWSLGQSIAALAEPDAPAGALVGAAVAGIGKGDG